jgi:hypothetical protein
VIILDIGQISGRNNPAFFTMPIDIQITAAGRDTTLTVFNDLLQQRFVIKSNHKPSAVLLDPDKWILKFVNSDKDLLPSEYILEQNYPNPFNSTTNIVYRLRRQEEVTLKIYDVLGREIAMLVDARQAPGAYKCQCVPAEKDGTSQIRFYSKSGILIMLKFERTIGRLNLVHGLTSSTRSGMFWFYGEIGK